MIYNNTKSSIYLSALRLIEGIKIVNDLDICVFMEKEYKI